MAKNVMLSTVDNPYSPFTNFDEWFLYDALHQYGSCEILARISHVSDGLTEEEYANEMERAVDEFIKYDFTGIYRKVVEDEPFNGAIEKFNELASK